MYKLILMHLLAALLCIEHLITNIKCCDSEYQQPCVEDFESNWQNSWFHSSNPKYQGFFEQSQLPPDNSIKVPKEALHYAITSVLKEPIKMSEGVILQFEAKWEEKHDCSGGYLKYYSHTPDFNPKDVNADTEYTVMFGPDKCGSGTNKVHLILKHRNKKTGEITEKHLKNSPIVPLDKTTHVYTAAINQDNTYELLIDGEKKSSGSLFTDFIPPIVPPEEIDDPNDKKPSDWIDEELMDDPDDTKPDDWVDDARIIDKDAVKPDDWLEDEPLMINDPSAERPIDWDDEEDGEWQAPLIDNPKCEGISGCGPWSPPIIDNPEYKGEWKAKRIPNPDYKGEWKPVKIKNPEYYDDKTPLKNMKAIGAVGIEIWTMDKDIHFDNILVVDDGLLAKEFRDKWRIRNKEEKKKVTEEAKAAKKAESKGESSVMKDILEYLVNEPNLAPFKTYTTYLLDLADENPLALYGLVFAFLSTFLFLFVNCLVRIVKKKKTREIDASIAKKEDITPDDVPVEKTVENKQKSEKDNQKLGVDTHKPEETNKNDVNTKEQSEIIEEKKDDDDENEEDEDENEDEDGMDGEDNEAGGGNANKKILRRSRRI